MNMDIKDLFAKLKGSKGDSRRNGGLTAFFEKNPKMKIIIPAILIGISVLVAVVIIVTTGSIEIDDTPVNGGGGQKVDVLPQDVRNLEDIDLTGDDVFDDVALANAKVTAIIVNSDGYYTATVEAENQSYPHLQVGDYVGSSSWLVEDITDDCVIVALGEKKIQIKF